LKFAGGPALVAGPRPAGKRQPYKCGTKRSRVPLRQSTASSGLNHRRRRWSSAKLAAFPEESETIQSMKLRLLFSLAAIVVVFCGLGGCRREATRPVRLVRVWCHQGQEAENRAMRDIARAFNAAHAAQDVRAEIVFFPDFQYTEKLVIAAAARDLPDVFDLDGPLLARLVAAGLLQPIDRWFGAAERSDFLPSILAQGTIDGKLFALGAFDSAVVLYYDRAMLARAGVTPPPDNTGWTWPEFMDACRKVRAAGMEPVALHMNETADEWFTYAFSPVIQSSGGVLISEDGQRVRGVLASPENKRSLQAWQAVFQQGLAATDPVDPDPFGNGKVAMDWSGHWMARSHLAKKGDRLGAMSLPRTGARPAAPCGSWCWGLSRHARDPEAAALWLAWVTDARHGVEPIVRANGAVPARRSAFAAFPEYAGPPYRLIKQQLETQATPRPRTPHYAAITRGFAAALRDIAHGAEVAARLRLAENEIQTVIDRRLARQNQTEAAP
jgi:multiple sugar transport system substrate-binding protein